MNDPKQVRKLKRAKRVRAKIVGTAERPRLVVRKSNYAITAQLVDDISGRTLASLRVQGKNIAAGKALGEQIAQAAKTKKISTIVYDRGPHRYHGVMASIADTAREGGLKF